VRKSRRRKSPKPESLESNAAFVPNYLLTPYGSITSPSQSPQSPQSAQNALSLLASIVRSIANRQPAPATERDQWIEAVRQLQAWRARTDRSMERLWKRQWELAVSVRRLESPRGFWMTILDDLNNIWRWVWWPQ